MKSAFTAIIGRPSAGKSTLINTLCEEKVSIVSPVPQTTRNSIRGVLTRPEGQIVFVDTPGYHFSEKKINLHMKDVAEGALEGIDLVIYLIDTSRHPGKEEEDITRLLTFHRKKLLIVLNKTDAKASMIKETRAYALSVFPEAPVFEISALKGSGIPELLKGLWEMAPEGELMYPTDIYTDQDPEFRIKEIIREKAISIAREEIPHAIYVEIADTEFRGEQPKQTLWVRAFLVTERESQKGILVGKKGENIKEIRKSAQKELSDIFPYRVMLDLQVKANPKWRNKENIIKKQIY
ncbi:MAG: GTPase Era [Spirochaetales bacterium]|nr:GTPase Era [Spirochaetales bacterium]